ALDEALVPHASRLRIGKSNFRLRSDIQSKESTLQLVYDVLRLTPFYKAFMVTTDVPEIYMQEFWAAATVHHHSISFKMNNKKHIVNLQYFREMLHIYPRLPNQTFDELPFEEEILAFFRYLGHSGEIKKITDGMYHKKNIDFAYLLWEDFVYQVEHKDAKKSNEMYYLRDDQIFTKIKLVSRHQNTQEFSAILPSELTNEDIRNSIAYKEYYVIASGAAPPKTKESVRKTQSSSDTTMPPPIATGTRLSTSTKGKQPANGSSVDEGTGIIPGVPDVPTDESDEEISWKSSDKDDDDQEDEDKQDDDDDQDENDNDQDTDNNGDDFVHPKLSIHEEEAKDEESFDPIVQTPEKSDDEGNDDASLGMNVGGKKGQDAEDDDESSSVSSQFVTSMLNPSPYAGTDSLFESTPQVDVQASTIVTPLKLTAPTLPPLTIPIISQFAGAVSSIPRIVERYMDQWMNEAVKIIKDQVKEQVKLQVSKILPKIKKTVNEKLEAKVLTRSSNSSKTSYVMAADLSELELKKILIEKMESNKDVAMMRTKMKNPPLDQTGDPREEEKEKSQSQQALQRKRRPRPLASLLKGLNIIKRLQAKATQHPEWFQKQKKPPTPDRAWNKTLPATHESIQPWISDLAKQADSRSSFNELIDTPVDFLAFLMNRLKVDTLTPELLDGPTYELMKGSYKSLVKLEFFLEEVYKIMSTSSGLKTWYLAQCGVKNRESARGVYSKRRIIAVTELQIVEWHNYKHLDWINVRRDEDKLYKFKEGDHKRLRIQDIEDMLLLLVQGKLTNLTVKKRFAFNVFLRMFTRSIVIQRRMEDLQLGVETYQKKLNLTNPDTYHSDLKRKEAYTTYSNPRGFIYQNKDKQNRLMWIDELHKFSDGTLNDV
nr:hypothetical protein [Tanacetum cinerariifolium]